MLTGLSIPFVFVVFSMIAVYGARGIIRDAWKSLPWRSHRVSSAAAITAIVLLFVAYYFRILSEPLSVWDARSIWFFHAKMIWVHGGLSQHGGWNHASLAFSHPDYPKLVPALAAELAWLQGHWNEFGPKASLLVMLVPLLFWIFSFQAARASFVLLVLLFFFSLNAW